MDAATAVTLAAGEAVDIVDFGFQPTASIGDTVYTDINGDGTRDPGDVGLAGVTVELLDGSGTVLATTTTNGFGQYSFGSLAAGNYTVQIDTSTLPASTTTNTSDPDGTLDSTTDLTLLPGASIDTADFGYQPLGSIGDTIYRDDNGNGTQDTGEPGLAGIDVELLDDAGTTLTTDTTDGNGTYTFGGLAAADYSVRVDTTTLPASTTTNTADPDGTLDSSTDVTLLPGADITTADFGYATARLHRRHHLPRRQRQRHPRHREPGLSGITVELLDRTRHHHRHGDQQLERRLHVRRPRRR